MRRDAVQTGCTGVQKLQIPLRGAILLLAALLPLLVEGRALLSPHPFWGKADNGDTLSWCAARQFEGSQLRTGTLPLWNPYLLNGLPWQTGPANMLHPGTAFQWVFHDSTVLFKFTLWASLTLACAFMTGLLRWWGMDELPAFVGGAVYAHGGFPLAHLYAGHLDVVITLAWAPLFLWMMLAGRPLAAALALAALIASGHYPLIYLTVWATLLLTLRQQWKRWPLVLALGLGLCAAQLLPVWQNLTTVLNRGTDPSYFTSFSVSPLNLLTLLVPHLYDAGATFFAPWPVWEGHLFFTVTGLVIMSAGVSRGMLAVCGLATLLALNMDVLQLYAQVDPLVSRFRAPGRFLFAVHLVAPFFLARGLQNILHGRRPKLAPVLTALFALAFLLLHYASPGGAWRDLCAWALGPHRLTEVAANNGLTALLVATYVRVGLALTCAALAWAALYRQPRALVALVLLELVLLARPWMITAAPGRFELHPDLATLQPGPARVLWEPRWANLGPAKGISEAGGYVPLATAAYSRAWAVGAGSPAQTPFIANFAGLPPEGFARLQGVRYAMGYDWPVVRGELRENPKPWPRAYVTYAWMSLPPEQAIVRAVKQSERARSQPGVEARDWEVFRSMDSPEVSDLRLEANRVSLTAGGGLLVLTDAWAPGWRARVDGREADVVPVNGGLHRGVFLQPGPHRVELFYWPESLTLGGWLTLASAVLLATLGLLRKRQTATAPEDRGRL